MAFAISIYFSSSQDFVRWCPARRFKGISHSETSHITKRAHEQRLGAKKAKSYEIRPSARKDIGTHFLADSLAVVLVFPGNSSLLLESTFSFSG